MRKYTYIHELCVNDPDTDEPVHIEVWKDNNSGGVFAIEATYLDQIDEFYNPFNGECERVTDYLPAQSKPQALDEFGE